MAQSAISTVLPTPDQELLLRAALLKGSASLDAWGQWQRSVDFEALDQGSYRVLPLLYANLNTQGVDDPLMGRMKGVYRLTWYKNQMLFRKMEALLRTFHEASIPTMLLKGSAVTLLYYRDYGLRPMRDFDVLIPEDQVQRAVTMLHQSGWKHKRGKTLEDVEFLLAASHAAGFVNNQGDEFDLHSRLGYVYWGYYPHDPWKQARQVQLHQVETLALSPVEQFVHLCVHGLVWNTIPPLRWIVDSVLLLQAEPNLDWAALNACARQMHVTLPIYHAMRYMRDLLNINIPEAALLELERTPVSRFEHLRLQVAAHPRNVVAKALLHYDRYTNLRQGRTTQPALRGFVDYLKRSWNVERVWQLPGQALLRGRQSFLSKRTPDAS